MTHMMPMKSSVESLEVGGFWAAMTGKSCTERSFLSEVRTFARFQSCPRSQEEPMDKDRVEGAAEQAKGKVKELPGK